MSWTGITFAAMAKKASTKLPALSGVKLLHTLRGHTGTIGQIVWSHDGKLLASISHDGTARIWDAGNGEQINSIFAHSGGAWTIEFSPDSKMIVTGGNDKKVKLWDVLSGKLIGTYRNHKFPVNGSVIFDNSGKNIISIDAEGHGFKYNIKNNSQITLGLSGKSKKFFKATFAVNKQTNKFAISGDADYIEIGNLETFELESELNNDDSWLTSLAFNESGNLLASGGNSKAVKIWDAINGKLLRRLEGHTNDIGRVNFSKNFNLLASKSSDGTVRIWSTKSWNFLGEISEPSKDLASGMAFHPVKSVLATVGSEDKSKPEIFDQIIHIWELDNSILEAQADDQTIAYTSAKIVLVGDSGVGKTGLGWRLANGAFKEHSSTHGQQFWLLGQLSKNRNKDLAQCEAILWDLAGQPDYRMIHALFLDDADLAIILFDPTRNDNPLQGVEFWVKQLNVSERSGEKGFAALLVAARADRGTARLTTEEIEEYCKAKGLSGYSATSALSGEGVEALIKKMQSLILWDEKAATVTTTSFKKIKEFVLSIKEKPSSKKVIFTFSELRRLLNKEEPTFKFTDSELQTAVMHLANHGYVVQLKTSRGEVKVLLVPELLNNLAASFILEARRNDKGLGVLQEQKLLENGYSFQELAKLSKSEADILLDSAALLFLDHNVCFRETDPLNTKTYLVFPELINLKKPSVASEIPTRDGVAYTVKGAVENVYASLVVLLGYTQTFTRTNQWQNHARYEVGNGSVCGFRQESEREGELDFVLYFGTTVREPVRKLFQGLFENFLDRRNLTVFRFEPVVCQNTDCAEPLDRSVLRQRMREKKKFAFCNECGEKLILPEAISSSQLSDQQQNKVASERRHAEQRTAFEKAIFRLHNYINEEKLKAPECFISYAWGDPTHERWVERNLATDLVNAGIDVVLDVWENSRPGASVPRFVERVSSCDKVLLIGTPLYKTKYQNKEAMRGFVAAAEGDLIGARLIGTEDSKESVFPILLSGTDTNSFPPLLKGRVYADFRNSELYFIKVLDLILDLYMIPVRNRVRIELRDSLI
jgi:small GTP-binding protein